MLFPKIRFVTHVCEAVLVTALRCQGQDA